MHFFVIYIYIVILPYFCYGESMYIFIIVIHNLHYFCESERMYAFLRVIVILPYLCYRERMYTFIIYNVFCLIFATQNESFYCKRFFFFVFSLQERKKARF